MCIAGCIALGARKGKYDKEGKVNPMPASALPLATLGTFLLWFGWFGFNGGSQLALGSVADASAMARIFCNTNLAAAGGVIVALLLGQILYKKVDLTFVLNGALGGLVSITAEPLAPTFLSAVLIGGVGGALVVFAIPLLDKLKIDDVVGAIPVHLVCGIWGTLAVPLTNADAKFSAQLIGIIAIGAFVLITSFILWFTVKAVLGIRLSEEEEKEGSDKSEIGLSSYPEFIK